MLLLVTITFALLALVSCASGGMDCLRNKDCATKYEHICNMQSGMWTKNYILHPLNGSYNEILDSCACCFLPDVYRIKVSQRGLFDSVMALESEAQLFVNRIKPCAPLRRSCSKTSDCCTGYCSASEQHEGFCNDPLVLRETQDALKFLASESNFTSKKRGHPLYSDLSPSSTSDTQTVTTNSTEKRTNGSMIVDKKS